MQFNLRTLLIVLVLGPLVLVVIYEIVRDLLAIGDYANTNSLSP